MVVKQTDNVTGLRAFARDVGRHLRARAGIIWVQTREERRVEAVAKSLAATGKYALWRWRTTTGLVPAERQDGQSSVHIFGNTVDPQTQDPLGLFAAIKERHGRNLYVIEDLSALLKMLWQIPRLLRDEAENEARLGTEDGRGIIIVDTEPAPELPGIVPMHLPLPTRDELVAIVESIIPHIKPAAVAAQATERLDEVVDALSGLEAAQAEIACTQSIAACKTLDIARLTEAKKDLIGQTSAVTWVDPDERGLDGIGGLERLKSWLVSRKKAFSREAKEFGLPRPKAILAAGLPGSGKSLTAKCVATAWQMPLLRFDVSAAFNKFVGESESGVRRALETAGAIAPCVVWIDEINALGLRVE